MKLKNLAILTLCFLTLSFQQGPKKKLPTEQDVSLFVTEYIDTFHPHAEINQLLFVSVKYQRLYLIRYGHIVANYPISTSKYGVGNKSGSFKTPLGMHWIKNKMGKNTPMYGILKGGVYTGEKADVEYRATNIDDDLVTTRVIWLEGMENKKNKGKKVDSYKRRIYIHGTPEEGLIGTPASHGCIRMNNYDVTELYDLVEKGLYVLILNV